MTRPVALLTGASRSNGIAWAIAMTLATDGWDVAFSYHGDYDRRMPLGGDPDRDRSNKGAGLMPVPGPGKFPLRRITPRGQVYKFTGNNFA